MSLNMYMKIFLFFCGAVFRADSEVTDSTRVVSVSVIPGCGSECVKIWTLSKSKGDDGARLYVSYKLDIESISKQKCLVTTFLNSLNVYTFVGAERVICLTDGVCPQIQCRVYNWENMTCTWNSTPGVNYDLHWSRGVRNCKSDVQRCIWANCSVQLNNSCIWSRAFYGDGWFNVDDHALKLEPQSKSSNAADKCGIVYIDPYDLVEPGLVKNLKIADKESRSAVITWDSPDPDANLVYRIIYSRISSRGVEEISAEKLAYETGIKLVNLRPGFTYSVLIDCRPLYRGNNTTGFWSSKASETFRTLDDVPEQAPLVTSGGFYDMKSSDGSSRSVVVYWKDIPEYFRNGNITEIRIRYRKVWPDTSPRPPESWQEKIRVRETSVALDLERLTDYEIMIDTRTSVGYNESLQLQQIIIPSNENDTYVNAQDFVVLRNSSVFYIMWNQSHNVDISYTVYLCRLLASNNVCNVPLEWITVPQNQTWLIFNRSVIGEVDISDLRIGISAEYKFNNSTVSSGIKWNQCFYNLTAELKPPGGLKAEPSDGSITLNWNGAQDTCNRTVGYHSHYVVRYWRDGNDSDSELVPGISYRWCVQSWSKLNESACSEGLPFSSSLFTEGQSSSGTVTIVVPIIIVLLAVFCGIACICRLVRHKKIPIRIPTIGVQHIETNGTAASHNRQYMSEYEPISNYNVSSNGDANLYEEIEMRSTSPPALNVQNHGQVTSSLTNNNLPHSRGSPTESSHADPNSGRDISDIDSYNLISPPSDSESYHAQPRSSFDPNRNPVEVTDQSSNHLGTSDRDLSSAGFEGSAPLNYNDSSQSNGISSYNPVRHLSSGSQSDPRTSSQSDRLLGLSGGSNVESGFGLPDPSLEPENRESEPLLLLRESSVGQQEDLDDDLETRSRSESESSDPYRGMGIERVLDCEELTAREALEQEQSRQEPEV